MPSPLKLLLRLLIVATPLLWFSQPLAREIVRVMIPIFKDVMMVMQEDFRVRTVELIPRNDTEALRLQVTVAHSITMNGRVIRPSDGWLEIVLTLGGVVAYGFAALIVVLAWPVTRLKEFAVRLSIALPLVVALLVVNVFSTWCAELDWGLYSNSSAPVMVWSRFLMGGGGYVLGLLCAAAAILSASRLTAQKHAKAKAPTARLVVTANSTDQSHYERKPVSFKA